MDSAVVASATSLSFTTSRDCAAPSRSRGAQRCRHIPRAASRAPHRTAQPRPARHRVRDAPVGVRSVPPPPRCAPRRQGQSGRFRDVCLPLGDETIRLEKPFLPYAFFILLPYTVFFPSFSFMISSFILLLPSFVLLPSFTIVYRVPWRAARPCWRSRGRRA